MPDSVPPPADQLPDADGVSPDTSPGSATPGRPAQGYQSQWGPNQPSSAQWGPLPAGSPGPWGGGPASSTGAAGFGVPPWSQPPPYGYQHYGAPWLPKPTDMLGRPLADWWRRLVAWIIDLTILLAAMVLIYTVFFVIGALGIAYVLSLLVAFSYFTLLIGGPRGQTFGMSAVGIAVRDERTGNPIGYGRAFLRYLLMAVFSWALFVPLVIDCLWPLWDRGRQAWHDKAAQSVVIDAR